MLRSLDGGWDNDNFLDSLGKTTEDQDQANDAYYQMSRYGPPQPEVENEQVVQSQPQQPPQPPNQQQQQHAFETDLPPELLQQGKNKSKKHFFLLF